MVVAIVISILAAIALVQLGGARDRTQLATLQSDLRVLATHQEIHHQRHMQYADNATALSEYSPSEVTVLEVTFASPMGWAARATHVSIPYLRCGVYWGDAPPEEGEPAELEGVINCESNN